MDHLSTINGFVECLYYRHGNGNSRTLYSYEVWVRLILQHGQGQSTKATNANLIMFIVRVPEVGGLLSESMYLLHSQQSNYIGSCYFSSGLISLARHTVNFHLPIMKILKQQFRLRFFNTSLTV